MREIRIDNPALNSYITDLASDYSSGVIATVRNNNSFAANDLAVFGNPTEELTELKKINSLTGSTVFNLASVLNFAHNKGTPVFKAVWDNVSIEANYGSGWTVITLSPVQWDSKSNRTIYFDSNGTDTTSYRFRFYNSVTLLYSEYSPTLTGAGFTRNQIGYIIREARKIAGDVEGRVMTTNELIRELVMAKYAVRGHNPRYWFWKVDGYLNNILIPSVSGGNVYSLSTITDLAEVDKIRVRYTNGNTDTIWNLLRKSDAEFQQYTRNLNRPNYDFPRFYRLLPPDANSTKGYFEVETKVQNSGFVQFYVDYYKDETNYASVADTTALVIPEIYEDYLIHKIYAAKGNDAMAQKYLDQFSGPQGKKRTQGITDLTGIALLDELDRQAKKAQGQPQSLWNFKGQKAVERMYGSRRLYSPDYVRENFFDASEAY